LTQPGQTAEQRVREIGTRKVLGESVLSLFGLLSRGFLGLVGISFVDWPGRQLSRCQLSPTFSMQRVAEARVSWCLVMLAIWAYQTQNEKQALPDDL